MARDDHGNHNDLEIVQIALTPGRPLLDRRPARSRRARTTGGPWVAATLDIIARRPATRAEALASELGIEKDLFKPRVRRLKELGLTESLEVGYRLSPRGEDALKRLRDQDGRLKRSR